MQAAPVPTTVMSGVSSIAAGYNHSLALKNGAVSAWGNSTFGQTTNVPVAAQSGVTQIAGGSSFSLALKTNGAVVAWGAGLIATNVPAALSSGVSQVAAGEWHALALKDGGVVAWGSNTFGESTVPSSLTSGVTAISGGGYYSMALKDGGVQIFGIAATNELEFGIQSVPAAATSGVTAISAGRWHALALKDGGVIAWGASNYFDATAVPVEATTGVTAIAAGDLFSIALKTNGSLVIWGDDTKGQLPIPVYAATGVTQIAAGVGHCLIVGPVMPPRFTAVNLPTPYIEYPYAGSVTATGNPTVHYFKFGVFPPWMTLHETTGAIGGTPPTNTANSIVYFTIVASNTVGRVTNTYTITPLVMPAGPPVFVTDNPLPDGVVGEPYELQIVASNTPVFSLVSGGGELPAGLTLSTNGLISGTPTTVQESLFFTVRATNLAGASNRVYYLAINPPPSPPEFYTDSPLPSGEVGQPYSVQIVASNSPVFSLLAGALPDGLTLSTNGLISGTPTAIDQASFTIQATNMVGASNRVYELEIFGPPVFVTTSPLANGLLNVPYSLQIEVDGEPRFSVAAGSLPNGLTLATNGLLSGTPTAVGPFNFTVHATNGYGWSNRVFDLLIAQTPVFSTPSPLPGGKLGDTYSQQIEATGAPLFSVVAGSLPGGLELSVGGLLSGTPTVVGAFNFTVRATNDYGWSNRIYDLDIANYTAPEFTLIRATNSAVTLSWTNPNAGGNVQVWRSTNITVVPVIWSNLGVQVSPWTNNPAVMPSYYQLRMVAP